MESTYALSGESEKLEVRSRMFDRQSKLFLNKFIRQGQKILEIGCGMGGATRMMANMLDNTGFIDAIDMNANYVDYVKKKLTAEGYQNFSIQKHQAESFSDNNKYDVVYGRAVLHHIPTAKKVMSDLLDKLKPGGIIAFEEPIMNTVFSQPEVKDFTKLFDWYVKLGENKNCDYLIGNKLNLYFQSLGINILESQILQIMPKTRAERITTLEFIDTIQEQLIETNIANQADIDNMKQSIEKLVYSNQIFYPPQFCQIIGQKRE